MPTERVMRLWEPLHESVRQRRGSARPGHARHACLHTGLKGLLLYLLFHMLPMDFASTPANMHERHPRKTEVQPMVKILGMHHTPSLSTPWRNVIISMHVSGQAPGARGN